MDRRQDFYQGLYIKSYIFTRTHFDPSFVSSYHFQEKHHQNLEHQLRLQELIVIKEEKKQLGNELEALRSKDKHIREWINRLEQILDNVRHIYVC